MTVTIRPMMPDDIPGLAAWLVTYPLWIRYGLTEQRAVSVLQKGLEVNDILLVADTDTVRAAGLAYVLPRGAFALSPYLRWLAVKPGMTGEGIGVALIDAAEAAAKPYRADLFLLAADFNTAAHRFYERQGYAHVGTVPDYVVSGVSEWIYWKRLRE